MPMASSVSASLPPSVPRTHPIDVSQSNTCDSRDTLYILLGALAASPAIRTGPMIPKLDNPASDRRTVVSADGTRLACEVLGDGPALVVVTGALSALDFPHVRQFAQTFATQFRVYVYDRRGRGGSADTPPYSVDK